MDRREVGSTCLVDEGSAHATANKKRKAALKS
jgi:hypothetical protein